MATLLVATTSLIFSSCSSPESDGTKAAKMKYTCENDYDVALNDAYVSYIKNFNFETRINARAKLSEIRQKAEANYKKCEQKVIENRNKLKNKYLTNKDKTEKFEYALYKAANDYSNKRWGNPIQEDIRANQNKIEKMILSVIPPRPDLKRLKNDLNYNVFNKELHSKYSIQQDIKSLDAFKAIELLSTTDNGDEYLLQVHLKGEVNQFDLSVPYLLGYNDDWTINNKGIKVDIVPTGKYNDCIETLIENYNSGGYSLGLKNLCDVALIVNGVTTATYPNGGGTMERSFAVKINANDTYYFGYKKYTTGFTGSYFVKLTVYKHDIRSVEQSCL